MKYLSKDKNGCYWLRRVISRELRSAFGKTQFQKRLGVVSQSKAESLAVSILSDWQREINAAKFSLNSKEVTTVPANVEEILATKDCDDATNEDIETVQDWVNEGYYTDELAERERAMRGKSIPSGKA